jgi:hypothetical protein
MTISPTMRFYFRGENPFAKWTKTLCFLKNLYL